MPHPETDTGPSVPHWGEKEQTVSVPIPLMNRTEVSHIPRIPVYARNLVLHVWADGNGNMSSVLMIGSPGLALALIATAPSLKSLWNRSLLLLSRTRRRLILLPLATNNCISDAPCILYLSLYSHSRLDHRVHVL